jgi:opacity protein-like surface antigen
MSSSSLRSIFLCALMLTAAGATVAFAQDPTNPDEHRPAPPAKTQPKPQPPPQKPATSTATKSQERPFRVAGFAEFGQTSFTASKSFNAILDKSSLSFVGGGGQFALRNGIFVQVDITHQSADGERAFVNNGQVFKLNIPATIELTPIDISAGYRFHFGKRTPARGARPQASPAQRFVPYVGGGIGTVIYKESSKFAASGDDVDESFTSYNFLAGLEVGIWRFVGAGVEFQQRWVPDGLGSGGVSKAFNETDLGGSTVRVKVIVSF